MKFAIDIKSYNKDNSDILYIIDNLINRSLKYYYEETGIYLFAAIFKSTYINFNVAKEKNLRIFYYTSTKSIKNLDNLKLYML